MKWVLLFSIIHISRYICHADVSSPPSNDPNNKIPFRPPLLQSLHFNLIIHNGKTDGNYVAKHFSRLSSSDSIEYAIITIKLNTNRKCCWSSLSPDKSYRSIIDGSWWTFIDSSKLQVQMLFADVSDRGWWGRCLWSCRR